MLDTIRRIGAAVAVALMAAACGGGGVSVDPLDDTSSEDVLSACEPAGGQETITLVEANDELPPVDTMEEAVADNPDAEFMVEQAQEDGRSREQALHQMYGQVVGQQLLADAQELPGFVTGAFARPEAGEPFRLSFAGEVPDELDPGAHDLESFGLEVTTGAAGVDHDAVVAAHEAAREVGIQAVSGTADETSGTIRVEVIDATPEQVADWESAIEDPNLVCLVRAERTVPCDDEVVADADRGAERQGEVLPNQQTDGEPSAERAAEVRRSYLGLTLEAAEDKATEEDRAVRVTVQDGVQLGGTDDLRPGRLSLTVCEEIVVDTHMDLEP